MNKRLLSISLMIIGVFMLSASGILFGMGLSVDNAVPSLTAQVKNVEAAPIAGATVTLNGQNEYTVSGTTDSSGKYVFQDIPAGQYTIYVSANTYITQHFDSYMYAGTGYTLDIQLAHDESDPEPDPVITHSISLPLFFIGAVFSGSGFILYRKPKLLK
jgi:hypothetical protein